jgi:2-polyprenyl-3-methyl-5-hydroxy-6-metoxy-1,4-benzoquinol methylase
MKKNPEILMNNSIETHKTDPVGTETLDNISEAAAFNRWMYSVISPSLKGKILEIGSGIGNISEFLINDKQNVTLSDLRSEYCEYLSDHFRNCDSPFSVEQINLIDPDFEQTHQKILNSFDTVFALNVIEHIENDSLAIQNCKKLLKESGTLIILVPSYQWLYCRLDKELGHFRRYNRKTLFMLFKKNGLTVDSMFNFNAAGIFGWFLFGKILNNKQLKKSQMRFYNYLVFIFVMVDRLLFRIFGLSLIITGRK